MKQDFNANVLTVAIGGYPIADVLLKKLWTTSYLVTETRVGAPDKRIRHVMPSFRHAFADGFHAAFNKSAFINSGLDAIIANNHHGWVVLKDSDIILPDDFPPRISNLAGFLDSRNLYGLTGRKLARTPDEVRSYQIYEPWEAELERLRPIPGYFNLFSLEDSRRRYPKSDSRRSHHDDYRFCRTFSRERVIELPIPCLHFGTPGINWSGSQADFASPTEQLSPTHDLDEPLYLKKLLSVEATLFIGIWTPPVVIEGSKLSVTKLLLDTRNLSQRSEDVLEEADRIFCWNRFVQGVADCPNVFLVGTVDMTPLPVPNSDEVRVRLPMRTAPMPEAVDHIHFGHEPSHEFIFEKLVPYLPKLKPGGWLSGTHYGLPGFPQTTSTIELLLGTPEIRDAAGGWALRVSHAETQRRRGIKLSGSAPLRETSGVALYVHDPADAARALTAVFSLRQQTEGGIAVLMWGREVPALRIACGRWGVEYVSIMEAAKARGDSRLQGSTNGEPAGFAREQARLLAMGYSPFAMTVMVGTDSTMPKLKQWWKALGVGVPPAGSGILPEPSGGTTDARSRKGTRKDGVDCYAGRAARRAGRPPYPAHVVVDDSRNTFGFHLQNAAFIRWQKRLRKSLSGPIRKHLDAQAETAGACRVAGNGTGPLLVSPEAEASLVAANPAHVWWPESCTIVTAPMAEDAEALEANWRSMKWPPDMQRWAVPISDEPLALPVPALELSPDVLKRFPNEAYWIQAILTAAARCKTKRLLYLDPCMRPVPGAELFYREEDQAAAYASAGWCFVRRGKRVLKTPKLGPPATLFDVAFLKRAAKAFAKEKKERNFEVFLHAFAKKEKRTVTVQDVMPCGWNR